MSHRDEAQVAYCRALLEGDAPSTSSDRCDAVVQLGWLAGSEAVESFAVALSDRALSVQTLALGQLTKYDHDGVAVVDAEKWLDKRLKARAKNRTWAPGEIPLAISYFAQVERLEIAAAKLVSQGNYLLPVERFVVDLMWPAAARQEWADGRQSARPNLVGLVEYGHPDMVYHLADSYMRDLSVPWNFETPESTEARAIFAELLGDAGRSK